jgi:hypothetical protein
MTDKDLYYDKYLKYKNKYLDLKVQIGGGGWNIISSYKPTHIIYRAIDNTTSINRMIFIEYKYEADIHTLTIIIKYDDNINIKLYFYYPKYNRIDNEDVVDGIFKIKQYKNLIKEFIFALKYIIENIKETNIKKFIINNIILYMQLPHNLVWFIMQSNTSTNIFYKAINIFFEENIIHIKYNKTDTDIHTIEIIIKYYDDINIELYLKYSSPTLKEITPTSLIGIDFLNENVELQEQFKIAIKYIEYQITITDVKNFMYQSINSVLVD